MKRWSLGFLLLALVAGCQYPSVIEETPHSPFANDSLLVDRFAACRRWRFSAQTFIEALKFIYPQNCPTKHETATFGKVLLPAGVLSVE